MKYESIINKINNSIKKYGIPQYLKEWKPYKMKNNYKTDEDFYKDLIKYIKSYHHHTSLNYKLNNTKLIKKNKKYNNNYDKKLPTFHYNNKDKIGTIKFYHYFLDMDDKMYKSSEFINLVNSVKNKLNEWNKIGLNGLIIDLRNHIGGWYVPFVYSLSDILNNKTLFAWSNKKVKITDKKWINFSNNNIKFNQKFLNNKIDTDYKIAVIIGKNTISSGEFCASIFYRNNKNIKIFGENSGGYFSVNSTINITNNLKLNLTSSLVTTVNGVFHEKQYLKPNIYTKQPLIDAKKWILN